MAYHHLTPGGESLGALFKKAAPGDEILAHAGEHKLPDGGLKIENVKGNQAHPIIFKPAGDGPVKITAKLPPIGNPDRWANPDFRTRTLQFAEPDYIEILDFDKAHGHEIVGGIICEGKGNAETIMGHDVELAGGGGGGWPGFGVHPNPEGFREALLKRGFKPTHGIHVKRCFLTGRGLALISPWDSEVDDNDIGDLEASSGSAIHVAGGWENFKARKNKLHGLAGSGGQGHFWNEAMRLGNRGHGGLVEENKAWDLRGNSRGFTSDVFATHMAFIGNECETGNIAYSLQYAIYNAFLEWNIARGADDAFKVSARDPGEVPYKGCVRGLVRLNDFSKSMVIRLISGYTFANNRVEEVSGSGLGEPFAKNGNTWEGGTVVKPNLKALPVRPPVEPPVEPPPPPPVEPPVEPPPVDPPVEPPVPGEVFDPALVLAAVVKMREGDAVLARLRSATQTLTDTLDAFKGLNESAQQLEDEAKRVG